MNNKHVGRNNMTYLHLGTPVIAKCVHLYWKLLLIKGPEFQVIWASPGQDDKVGEICLDVEILLLLPFIGLLP